MEDGGAILRAIQMGGLASSLGSVVERRYVSLTRTLIAAGVVLRVIMIGLTTTGSDPANHLYPGYGDGARYKQIAQSLVETGTFGYSGRPTAFRSPAYPALIALTWKIFGETLTPIRLLQVAMFVLMAVVYTPLVADRFGKPAGILATALLSLHPMFLFMSTEIATESLYMALECCVFALTLEILDPSVPAARRPFLSFAAGLCCGAGALTRPNMFVLFMVIVAMIAWEGLRRRAPLRVLWLSALAFILGTYLVLTPWLLRNQRIFGAKVLATNIDYNLFRGTFDVPGALPSGDPGEKILVATFGAHGVLYEGEVEDVHKPTKALDEVTNEKRARAEALAIIGANPARWIRERLRNTAYLWLNLQWEEARLSNPIVFLASLSVTVLYYLLLISAIVGSVVLLRQRGDPQQLRFCATAWLFILAVMPVVLTIVGKRYRLAMIDPYLVLLASAGLGSWVQRRSRTASMAGVVREPPGV